MKITEFNNTKYLFMINSKRLNKISLTDYLVLNSKELLYFLDLQDIIENKLINLFKFT